MAVEYDPAIIGKVFDVTDPVPVTAAAVRDYCAALGETNPLFTDEEAARKGPHGRLCAPPSFAVTFRTGRDFWQHVPRFGRSGFDAGKDVEFLRPIFIGDQITLELARQGNLREDRPQRLDGLCRDPLHARQPARRNGRPYRPSLHAPLSCQLR